jgi:hypothetical protein
MCRVFTVDPQQISSLRLTASLDKQSPNQSDGQASTARTQTYFNVRLIGSY